MKINGRDVHFLYTIRAYIQTNEWVANNENKSAAEARLRQAIFMHEAYLKANGSQEALLTIEELEDMPVYVLTEILQEADAAVAEGSKRKVESAPKKKEKEART
ncbi:MAG: hypothetical protein IJI24_06935 [Lachnospiraceae bacterium]|nr:hypothetical protein [Lachnospiraceae bacterium]